MPTIQIIWTVVAFVVFVGIVFWAYSSKRQHDFDEASRLPLGDDMERSDLTSGENKDG